MSEELRGLDRWIEGEPPDPGTGDGIDHPLVMTCSQCAWRASSTACLVFSAALDHIRATGHVTVYRGCPQDLSRYLTTEQQTAIETMEAERVATELMDRR